MSNIIRNSKVIIFESHSTSEDNEKGIASGHFDSPLSKKGKEQALALGKRYEDNWPDVILCSDLSRSCLTAQIAFPAIPRIICPQLREWDYGVYNGHPVEEIERLKLLHIQRPFPEGESLEETVRRILTFLDQELPYEKVMIIAHRSAYYALEHRFKKLSLTSILNTPWVWRPGWIYFLDK